MPVDIIKRYLLSQDTEKRIKMQLALHCAPFIKRKKISSIMTLSKNLVEELVCLLKQTDIDVFILKEEKENVILFLYRKQKLEQFLRNKSIESFLRRYGYDEKTVEEMLSRLKERMSIYYLSRMEFPHEIGAFLGYPMEDVEGFIENEGQNCLFSGYWKVYEQPEAKKKIFEEYDHWKRIVVQETISGLKLEQIAC